MGGKLFNAPRIENEDYKRLQSYFAAKFEEIGRKTWFPDGFKKKETHGDLDIIIAGDTMGSPELTELFDLRPEWISRNSNVISVFYQGKYQVDLCFHQERECETTWAYMRCGDASNLIGRLAHSLGFKLGHQGLSYPVKLSDCESLGEVIISTDRKAILEFLDLDYEQWKNNFDTQEELYEWLVKSKYFNPEKFQLENLNHINRIRNAKRPVYTAFIEWLKGKEFAKVEEPKNKAECLWQAILFFNCHTALGQINDLITRQRRKKQANTHFNGELVMEWSTLDGKVKAVQGKELGAVLAGFRRMNGLEEEEDWLTWRVKNSPERTKEEFLSWFKKNRLTFRENEAV